MRSSVSVLLGLVFLMASKPSLAASIGVMLTVVVLGAALSLLFRKA
jgi:hypothetical protein